MKKIFSITLLLFVSLLVLSCRNDSIPEDIHEHEEIEKLVVTLTNKNDQADIQTINYIGGQADALIDLEPGTSYSVELDYQVKHGDHYESANDEIIEEKDEHFITYEFAGAAVDILRSASDIVRTDGKKLGLKTEWSVSSVGITGAVNIKLVHLPATTDQNFPAATNQQGKTTGGETDVNAMIPLH